MKLSLARPDITEAEINAVVETLKSSVLSIGPKIQEFEKAVATYTGRKHAVAVNSGTSGLHLIVRALGIKDGDEVITTPFSFVSSANCMLFERAVPVFVDIDPKTLNIDVNQIEKAITPKTKAILPVHVFGQPADMRPILDLAEKYHLKVIEDSCEALGAEYKGQKAGAFGDAAVFAFYPNKQITTGEGGIIVTDDDEIALLVQSMRSQGRAVTGLWLRHERLGFNYRMDELSATLGVVQMSRLNEILGNRERVASLYNETLKDIEGVELPYISPDVKTSWFVYVVRFDRCYNRDRVMQRLIEEGVACRPYFTPIHLQPFYRTDYGYHEGMYPVTEDVGSRSLALPFHNHLTQEEVDYVAEIINKILREEDRN